MNTFRYIKVSLVLVLGFVGCKMLLTHHFLIGSGVSLGVIVALLAGGALASLLIKPKSGAGEDNAAPPLTYRAGVRTRLRSRTSRQYARAASAPLNNMSNIATSTYPAPSLHAASHEEVGKRALCRWPLWPSALGRVYGDIGTSPLYAMRECSRTAPTESSVPGVVSLICWSLVLVVVVKYLTFVLATTIAAKAGSWPARAVGAVEQRSRGAARAVAHGFDRFGAAICRRHHHACDHRAQRGRRPAVAASTQHTWSGPSPSASLVGVFMAQRRGTGQIGAFFGPAVLLWL